MHNKFSDEEIASLYKMIGSKVQKLRKEHGITQLELSHLMGYKSVSLVSAAELYSNEKHFNIQHLYKISKIFKVPISDFFEE